MFSLHPTLQNDYHLVQETASFSILLNKNACVPWLICVPHTDKKNYHELNIETKNNMTVIITELSKRLEEHFKPDKINIAEIGNLVPQMHIHIIARSKTDPCWPKPIWGNLNETKNYTQPEIEFIKNKFTLNLEY